MPLPPGTKLGPYEVLAQLGAGGMGEVYKGRKAAIGTTSIPPRRGVSLSRGIPARTSIPRPCRAFCDRPDWKETSSVMRYAVVIEKGERNYSAYVPDLPGCVAAADTLKETEQLIREAIEIHIRGMREDGMEIPDPTSLAREIEVVA